MLILSQTDANIATITSQIQEITQDAIKWFDSVRNIEQLANTKFTFTISQLFEKREELKLIEGNGFN